MMKAVVKFIVIGIVVTLLTYSCQKNLLNDISDQNGTQDIEDLIIDGTFDWNMSYDVETNISIYESLDTKEGLSNVEIELRDITTNNLLLKGSTDENGALISNFAMPTSSSYVLLSTSFKDTLLSLKNGQLICDLVTDSVVVNGSLRINKISRRRAATNLMTNGDFETNSYDSTGAYYDSKVDLDKWYVRKGNGNKELYGFIAKDGSNHAFKLDQSSGEAYCFQVIDGITAGKKYQLSAAVKTLQSLGDYDCEVRLQFMSKKNQNTKSTYSLVQWTTSWSTQTVSATAPKNADYLRVVCYLSNKASKGSTALFDDISVTELEDIDNDGVDDENDDYPNDSTRAYDNHYPSSTSWASLVFEDMWPSKGDYDFNDLVIDYRMNPVTNSENKVVEIVCDYRVRAIGAGYKNGFGIMLPVLASNVSNVTGQIFGHSLIVLSSNNTEASQKNAVVIFFDDVFKVLPHPGNGVKYVNTDETETYVTPTVKQLVISFKSPQDPQTLGNPPYNPFLIANLTRGREIHLPNYEPTDLADSKYFGTEDDNSSSSQSRYYVTSGTLPWALNIPYEFDYPMEKARITDAYLKFGSWAVSNGISYTDWYTNKTGYRSLNSIYTKP